MVCRKCGSNEIVEDANAVFCRECGTVNEDSNIVNEVGFLEHDDGTSTVTGQFVSERGTSKFRSKVPGYNRQSREVTIEKGVVYLSYNYIIKNFFSKLINKKLIISIARKRIQTVASSLKLNNSIVEAAHRLYLLALQHNFVNGRRTHHVVAACLYIACRRERSPHMLIDFSDVLQTNVYVLGHTFLNFCHLLNFHLPLVDPSLYIQRFAARLEFEDKTQTVANTALRIVQRMKRDWLQTGRRPAGICGASLFIAARLHGFRRTPNEIIQIVRVCDVTLRKRLYEFEDTPSGLLTAEEFQLIDLEDECDPPAYTFNLKKVKENKNTIEESNNAIESPIKKQKRDRQLGEGINGDSNIDLPLSEIEREMEATLKTKEFQEIEKDSELQHQLENASLPKQQNENDKKKTVINNNTTILTSSSNNSSSSSSSSNDSNAINEKEKQNNIEAINEEEEEDEFTDLDDKELTSYIMSSEEVTLKTELWNEMNKEFIKQEAEKQEKMKNEQNKPKKPRKKREPKRTGLPETPIEAAADMLKRKVSTKVNYSALEHLFSKDELLFSTPPSNKTKKREIGFSQDSNIGTPVDNDTSIDDDSYFQFNNSIEQDDYDYND